MFQKVKFNGTFRSYQQKVLDGAKKYLSDGRINIVAAPGSGKTILGLELIRRLNKPCLILSPTTTIRDQWGERYLSFVTDDGAPLPEYSGDLRKPAAITSVTYQALYSAVERINCAGEEGADYSDVDVFKTVKDAGIETVCLDEAHHLQNEWQKALESFIKKLGKSVKIIALTATPPYDANPAEWKRYVEVCGEIDEEIFVPELVRQGTLCPHQDFVYFNYPEKTEVADFFGYRKRVAQALYELQESGILQKAHDELVKCVKRDDTLVYVNIKEISLLMTLFIKEGVEVDKKLIELYGKNGSKFSLNCAEQALNFLAGEECILDCGTREELKEIFKKHKLVERGKIAVDLNDKLKRRLVSSSGKLKGIGEIALSECETLGKKLRMLVLTDYIKRENLSCIGTDETFDAVNIVSVFETLRRLCPYPLGAVTGTLVILPESCEQTLKNSGARFTKKALGRTGYAEYKFTGGNREKVKYAGALFENGEINVLVGTASLLGEGWDSPCINSLILASFVGSFMLSNQMRGRAIRTDKGDKDKTSAIWHLVTVEPQHVYSDDPLDRIVGRITESSNEMQSCDYESLKRRFECFVAPEYDTGVIRSGIERISIIKPPYTKSGIDKINSQMCELSKDRAALKEVWDRSEIGDGTLTECTEIPKKKGLPAFTFIKLLLYLTVAALAGALTGLLCFLITGDIPAIGAILAIPVCIIATIAAYIVLIRMTVKVLKNLKSSRSVKNTAQCILNTLKQLKLVNKDCRLKAENSPLSVTVSLENVTPRDSKTFHSAVKEIFSPIENPRYLLIPKQPFGGFKYKEALACPSVFGAKKENAEAFGRNLKSVGNKYTAVYARTEDGKKHLKSSITLSYINSKDSEIKQYKCCK